MNWWVYRQVFANVSLTCRVVESVYQRDSQIDGRSITLQIFDTAAARAVSIVTCFFTIIIIIIIYYYFPIFFIKYYA